MSEKDLVDMLGQEEVNRAWMKERQAVYNIERVYFKRPDGVVSFTQPEPGDFADLYNSSF